MTRHLRWLLFLCCGTLGVTLAVALAHWLPTTDSKIDAALRVENPRSDESAAVALAPTNPSLVLNQPKVQSTPELDYPGSIKKLRPDASTPKSRALAAAPLPRGISLPEEPFNSPLAAEMPLTAPLPQNAVPQYAVPKNAEPLALVAPEPRIAQQAIVSPDVKDSPKLGTPVALPPLPALAETTMAKAPNLGEALKLLDSIDPATQQRIREQADRMLQNPQLLESLMNTLNPEAAPETASPSASPVPMAPPPSSKPKPSIEVKPAPRPRAANESPTGESLPRPTTSDASANPAPEDTLPAVPGRPNIGHMPGHETGDEHLVLNIHDTDLREVLEVLSEQGGLNILASPSVEGKVSCTLRDVDVNTALNAILKSTGFISRREGKLIFVGTTQEFNTMKTALDSIGTRVFRLNYVTAKELQTLVTPLLTPSIGKMTVTSPAQVGIGVDGNASGGDNFASNEAIIVQDYEAVLHQVEQIVREIDRRPMQVSIEAMIISVTLNDENSLGVDFQFLRNEQNVRFGTGTPRINPLNGSGIVDQTTGGIQGEFAFTQGGLQFAFLDDSLGVFVNALEKVGDVNVVAHPRLTCLNRQKAEILIGAQIGFITTTLTQTFSTQTVQFLDVGTQLRLRPFISTDGTIRLEVHPEISDGTVSAAGVPSKNVTQVTTNVMCYDGATVVIGGLMQENLQSDSSQVPIVGSLPVIGPLFRSKQEKIVRREILVLLTPKIIYDPESDREGKTVDFDGHRRQKYAAEEMTLLSRTYQGRRYVRLAEQALAQGERERARRYAYLAIHFDPSNQAAIEIYEQVKAQFMPVPMAPGRLDLRSPEGIEPSMTTLDGEKLPVWLLDDLEGRRPLDAPLHPRDPGLPGPMRRLDPDTGSRTDGPSLPMPRG